LNTFSFVNDDQEENGMSVGNSRIGVAVTEVKFPAGAVSKELFASAHVVVVDVDGRRAQGWVHLVKQGPALAIDSFDEYDDVDPGLLEFAVGTESDAIIAAVQVKIAEEKLAA
jgi:hypothetical protein